MRMAILSFSYHMTVPISAPVGAWLYNFGGYVCVFGASLGVISIAYIYMLLRLWNFEEKIKAKGNSSFTSLVHPRHVLDSVSASFKPRPNHKRSYLLIMMMVMLLSILPSTGERAYQFLFVKRLFSWGVSQYSWYNTTASLVSSLAMFILFPIFHRLKINENFIIIISCLSQIGGALTRGLSTKAWIFYFSTAVDFGTSIVSPPIRAQISYCVEPHELGKIFAMLASVESLIPILATNVYTRLYNATRELDYPLPGNSKCLPSLLVIPNQTVGSCYFLSCGFILLGLVLTSLMAVSLRCKKIASNNGRKLIRGNSNRFSSNFFDDVLFHS